MTDNNGGKHWMEYFRLVTPFLQTIIVIGIAILSTQLNKMDDKIFAHLTNDEIHAPRTFYVQGSNFDLYQKMRDKEMQGLYDCVNVIRSDIKRLLIETRDNEKSAIERSK